MSTAPPTRYLRLRHIIGNEKLGIPALLPISRSSWFAGVRDGRYPPPIKIGLRTAVWRADDIEHMLESLGQPSSSKELTSPCARTRDLGEQKFNEVLCGASCRRSPKPCARKALPGKTKCKFHGGRSTGPTTPNGKKTVTSNLPSKPPLSRTFAARRARAWRLKNKSE